MIHKSVKVFCAPTSLDASPLNDPATHLKSYRLQGPHVRQTNVEVQNTFGTFFFDTRKTYTLMVPTAKTIAPNPPPPGPPDPLTNVVDHYRCVQVNTTPGTPPFPKNTLTFSLTDQFGTKTVKVGAPTKLCVPTNKNGEGIKNPAQHLMCYRAITPAGTHIPGVQTNNQFGAEVLTLLRERELCVPSLKNPY